MGNVRAVVSDVKVPEVDGSGNITNLTADVVSASDYYPFGMQMPGRSFSSNAYRYGFQGQEKDDEIKGEGNSLSYKYRIQDTRLGRFLSVDPLFKDYAFNSPYAFSENRVIDAVELEGREKDLVRAYDPHRFDTHRKPKLEAAYRRGQDLGLATFAATMLIALDAYVTSGRITQFLAADYLAYQATEYTVATSGDAKVQAAYESFGKFLPLTLATPTEWAGIPNKLPKKEPVTDVLYKRPNNATIPAQREAVQGLPCVDCGVVGKKNVADHKRWLVKEWYQTGTIDKVKMKTVDAIQPQCVDCSLGQAKEARKYSMEMRKVIKERTK